MRSAVRENYREDIAGRANVEDTPELLAYYGELERLEAGALWTVANKIEPWQPKSASVPVLWRYRELREHVLRSVELVTPEKAGRRVIYLNNPGRRDVAAAVGWLYSGLQVMQPGEVASAHAHSASALRFIMEGAGAYTIVDGHKMTLGASDFVLTPNGTWHEHGVEADGSACIWQDGLDIPLVNALEANFYAVHPDLQQATAIRWTTWRHLGQSGTAAGDRRLGEGLFAAAQVRVGADLRGAAALRQGDRRLAVRRHPDELRQSRDRRPGDADDRRRMQLLRPGEHTKAHRHTGSFIYQVAKGSGHSIIDGQRFDWQERDIFCVPSWAWHEHANALRERGRVPVLLQRPAGDAGARPLSRGGLRRQRRPADGRGLRALPGRASFRHDGR